MLGSAAPRLQIIEIFASDFTVNKFGFLGSTRTKVVGFQKKLSKSSRPGNLDITPFQRANKMAFGLAQMKLSLK
jgi:hypothetical protein